MEIINITGINPLIKAIKVYDQSHINFLNKYFNFPKFTYTYEDRFISKSGVYTENVISLHKLKYIHYDEFIYECLKFYWNANNLTIAYCNQPSDIEVEEIINNLEGWCEFRKGTSSCTSNALNNFYLPIERIERKSIYMASLTFVEVINNYKRYKSLQNIDNMLDIIKDIENES
jgi:hypothetical protein